MSDYRPIIETVEDWNEAIEACGCCPMPICPVPIEECEIKVGVSTCYDGSEKEALDILHQAWEDGGMVGDEPVEPIDVDYGCWRPWARPTGADADDLPTIYRSYTYAITQNGEIWYTGTTGEKESGNDWNTTDLPSPFVQASFTYHATYTYTNEPIGGEAAGSTSTAYSATWDTDGNPLGCVNDSPGGPAPTPEIFEFNDGNDWTLTEAAYTDCTETVRTYHGDLSERAAVGTPQSAQSCGSEPWGQAYEDPGLPYLYWVWASSFEKQASGYDETLGDPLTKLTLVAEAGGNLAAEWTTGGCAAITDVEWPTIGLYTWGNCDLEAVNIISATVTKLRFRLIVPNDWQTLGGDIPTPGVYFKETWDLVFFPTGYDPEDPLSPQPVILANDQTDTWTGPGSGAQDDPSWIFDGGWHEIEPPYFEGEVRRVNRRFECYRPTNYGGKPQVTGEAYEIP